MYGDAFTEFGQRVPFIVISPYSNSYDFGPSGAVGYIDHTLYDHASVLRFIENKFNMRALSYRDANANPLSGGVFNFSEANPQLVGIAARAPGFNSGSQVGPGGASGAGAVQ